MKRFAFIAYVLGLAIVPGVLWMMGTPPGALLQLAAFLICPLGTFVLLLTHYNPAEMGHAFRVAGKGFAASREELSVASEFFGAAQTNLVRTGVLGLILGIIHVMDETSRSTLATDMQGYAVALISIVYALGFGAFVIGPFASAVKKKLAMLGQ